MPGDERQKVILQIGWEVDSDAIERVKAALNEGGTPGTSAPSAGRGKASGGGQGGGGMVQQAGGEMMGKMGLGGLGRAASNPLTVIAAVIAGGLKDVLGDMFQKFKQELDMVTENVSAHVGTREGKDLTATRVDAMRRTTQDLGIAAAFMDENDPHLRELLKYNRDMARLEVRGRNVVRDVGSDMWNGIVRDANEMAGGLPNAGAIPERFQPTKIPAR